MNTITDPAAQVLRKEKAALPAAAHEHVSRTK